MDASSIMLLLVWGMVVGFVFSSIGAAGGILASFGLITLIGINDPNSIKPMAQILAIAVALVFIPGYYKRKFCIIPLGLLLSAGGILGAFTGSTISSLYLTNMKSFQPIFGVLSLIIALQIIWAQYADRKNSNKTVLINQDGIQNIHFSLKNISFDYAEKHYSFNTWIPVLAGFIIAFIASIFGVGGGFLLVPFLASFLNIPMFIIPATAAIAILAGGIMSVSNYIRMGSDIDYGILLFLIIGGIIGAMLGPIINRVMKENWLQATLAIIVASIGLKYLLV